MRIDTDHITTLLDGIRDELSAGESERALDDLFTGLCRLRANATPSDWQRLARTAVGHELRQLVHEDPMSRRSFERPRGYPGDAVLLDYLYRYREPEDASPLGRRVYEYTVGRPVACAVRHRRERIGRAIDRAADEVPHGARVLSVGCGHLREAEDSRALRDGRVERLIALDADAETLAIVAARGMDCVVPMEMSADRLLLRWGGLGRFDLVYSAGLYDYLAAPLAQRLTTCLFEMLTPGGRLLVGNFLPNQPDAGYMETYMGWQLLHRTDAELAALTTDLPSDKVAQARTHSDPFGTIGYLEVRRVS